jgi:tRNA U34 5-carboxymethylaminomethyl modifying GTPase MnmE/TrmE
MGAEELKYAAHALGKISGKVDPEEILGLHPKTLISGVIFADFCIGK